MHQQWQTHNLVRRAIISCSLVACIACIVLSQRCSIVIKESFEFAKSSRTTSSVAARCKLYNNFFQIHPIKIGMPVRDFGQVQRRRYPCIMFRVHKPLRRLTLRFAKTFLSKLSILLFRRNSYKNEQKTGSQRHFRAGAPK